MHISSTSHHTFEIDLLRTFQAVVRFEQFLAAASYLNRSPSAVSVHIKRLENLVGGRLLDRDNQQVILTPLGRRFALQSTELLRVHDRMLASYSQAGIRGRVRLGISDEYAERLLQGLLAHLAAGYPDIELEIQAGTSGKLRARLDSGQLDLAVVAQPLSEDAAPTTPLQRFGTTEPVWAASEDFRMDREKPVPLALHAEGCPYRAAALDMLAQQGKRWRTVLMSASMTALETAVSAGLAVGIIDRFRLGPRMRVLSAEEGFSPLGLHEIQLIGTPGEVSDAVDIVGRLAGEHFRR
ncbi:LysR substrate-binding domain-containing protein [Pseudomonas sp. JDS28PS106]|uniref:LysR substrate-binding domain-containing protein n=1 Tax=Pseudomonas sp. JDS28PS106 TaxID=2497235 RepID=UPI002FD60C3D